ncbi:hypothetical protein LQF76_05910 [Gloeomargaritales cyanobacterium VI4D9]|nr:hypothetical protein LQF76_12980 [Gloeomargaritales cyanobacterium VI4D9]WAS06414.1 hypothetical protein LQF76_05910 [Gloeomargaritales cyanobacterium VI4D9]
MVGVGSTAVKQAKVNEFQQSLLVDRWLATLDQQTKTPRPKGRKFKVKF